MQEGSRLNFSSQMKYGRQGCGGLEGSTDQGNEALAEPSAPSLGIPSLWDDLYKMMMMTKLCVCVCMG